jgi:hypothetical protein
MNNISPEELKQTALLKRYKQLAKEHGELVAMARKSKDPIMVNYLKDKEFQDQPLTIRVTEEELPKPKLKSPSPAVIVEKFNPPKT